MSRSANPEQRIAVLEDQLARTEDAATAWKRSADKHLHRAEGYRRAAVILRDLLRSIRTDGKARWLRYHMSRLP